MAQSSALDVLRVEGRGVDSDEEKQRRGKGRRTG